MCTSSKRSRLCKLFHGMLAVALATVSVAPTVTVANWDPTLLVNTESFVEIDDGDGSTDIELRFGGATNRLYFDAVTNAFTFTKGIIATGSITGSTLAATGLTNCSNVTTNADGTLVCGGIASLTSDLDLRYVNSAGDTMTGTLAITNGGNLTVSGGGDVTVTGGDVTTDQAVSAGTTVTAGTTVNAGTSVTAGTSVNAGTDVNADGTVVLNADGTADTAVLTFGGASSQTLTYSTDRFVFSDDLQVTGNITATGNLSGNSLTVSSDALNLNGVAYSITGTQGAANTVLTNDGAGNLVWAASAIGEGSGSFLSFSPEYPNASYAPDGTNNVGRMKLDVTSNQNYYEWSTTRGTAQDYDINVRVRVPENFSGWSPVGVQMQYANGAAATAAISVLDTTGAADTSGTGPAASSGTVDLSPTGTYTAGGYMTIKIKMSATNAGNAKVGYLNINWITTTP